MTRPPWAASTSVGLGEVAVQKLTIVVSYYQSTPSARISKGYLRGNESLCRVVNPGVMPVVDARSRVPDRDEARYVRHRTDCAVRTI